MVLPPPLVVPLIAKLKHEPQSWPKFCCRDVVETDEEAGVERPAIAELVVGVETPVDRLDVALDVSAGTEQARPR